MVARVTDLKKNQIARFGYGGGHDLDFAHRLYGRGWL